jgi:type II secretory pathway predicted ATPase ExeA
MDDHRFGFGTQPFSETSDPAIFFPSDQHEKAEAVLRYALESQAAFCLLTGEIGCGKTLLVHRLLSKLGDDVWVGLINQTHTRLQSIAGPAASALGIALNDAGPAGYDTLVTAIGEEYARGRSTLLIVDEAQNMSVDLLEELRLLSNSNAGTNVLQILLVGQPELRTRLNRPQLLQFAQRISTQFHLRAFNRFDTQAYIRYRLQTAGGNPYLFTPEAMDLIHARTGGVPRLINQLCRFALVQGYATDEENIDSDVIRKVTRESWGGFTLQSDPDGPRGVRDRQDIADSARMRGIRRLSRYALPAVAAMALALVGVIWWRLHPARTIETNAIAATSGSQLAPSARAPAQVPAVADAPIAEPAPARKVAPAAVTTEAPKPAPVRPASVAATPSTRRSAAAAAHPAETVEPAVAQPATAAAPVSTHTARPAWFLFLYHASERLSAGDTAGAERLLQQASSAGASAEDIADLRATLDAQKLEQQLIAAGDRVREAITSEALLEPATDNAQTRYHEMLALSSSDPSTLRARHELQAALLVHAEDAIQKQQFDLAQRFLTAASGIGSSAQIVAAQERLRDEMNRAAQRATSAASVPTAQVVDVSAKETTAAKTVATEVSSHRE